MRCPHGMLIGSVPCEIPSCVAARKHHRLKDGKVQCRRCNAYKDQGEFSRDEDGRYRSRCIRCETVRKAWMGAQAQARRA